MFGYPKKKNSSPYYLAPRDENLKNQRYQISNRFEPYTHVQKEEKTLNTDVELRSARVHILSFYLLKIFHCSLYDPFLWQVSSKQALSIPTLTFVRTRKLMEIRLLTRCLEISIVGVAIRILRTAHFSLADCLVTLH